MSERITPWSKISNQTKAIWLDRARKEIYPGLEPVDAAKEATIPVKARELYYNGKQ